MLLYLLCRPCCDFLTDVAPAVRICADCAYNTFDNIRAKRSWDTGVKRKDLARLVNDGSSINRPSTSLHGGDSFDDVLFDARGEELFRTTLLSFDRPGRFHHFDVVKQCGLGHRRAAHDCCF
ncbi:hypothetical protein H257_05150 [Aphanomyces astaci]|uniref:Uncharacterized protein n=1 Tax=Aphanomyces astaci TaxID=112090 RepID=W4GTC9_APHAT|nr:hypothetical protein H257_05150 [Aphanomyces astaci]ETV82546.1 hypothetical protein H257_05150 [Aphanomyces astaci]|eukprot:XP_009828215.1 hypothetical protein H257_05150 [Aphanomyces astaci]